jgi:alkanesulfonate monooxygenase SsuD/methylene tetrahydromethanopterin reductase-like flavin-dependent oxidoreductase (luciferase family)
MLQKCKMPSQSFLHKYCIPDVARSQLGIMKRLWSGKPLNGQVGEVGPRPVQARGPELVIGGWSAATVEHVKKQHAKNLYVERFDSDEVKLTQ